MAAPFFSPKPEQQMPSRPSKLSENKGEKFLLWSSRMFLRCCTNPQPLLHEKIPFFSIQNSSASLVLGASKPFCAALCLWALLSQTLPLPLFSCFPPASPPSLWSQEPDTVPLGFCSLQSVRNILCRVILVVSTISTNRFEKVFISRTFFFFKKIPPGAKLQLWVRGKQGNGS